MAEHADVVIGGLGTGGEDVGLRLAEAGLDVIGIEPALLGGECAYWACIPEDDDPSRTLAPGSATDQRCGGSL